MIIENFSCQHFKRLNTVNVPFSSGSNLIVGENGSGKSTLLTGILYALFGGGATSTTKANMVTIGSGKRGFSIQLEIVQDNERYVIRRTGSSASIKQIVNGEEQLKAESHTAVTAYVANLIGLSSDEFKRLVCSEQGDTLAIAKWGAANVNSLVEQRSGVALIDSVNSLANSEITELDAVCRSLNLYLEEQNKDQLVKEINFAQEHLEDAKVNLESIQSEKSIAVCNLSTAKRVASLVSNLVQYAETAGTNSVNLSQNICEIEKELAQLTRDKAQVGKTKEELEQEFAAIAAEAVDLEIKINQASENNKRIEDLNNQLKALKNQQQELQNTLNSQQEPLPPKDAELSLALDTLDSDFEKNKQELKKQFQTKIDDLQQKVEGLQSELSCLKSQEIELDELKKTISQKEDEESSLVSESLKASDLVQQLSIVVAQASDKYQSAIKAKESGSCTMCERPFDDVDTAELEEAVKSSNSVFNSAQHKLNLQEEEQAKIQADIKRIREEIKQLKESPLHNLNAEIDSVNLRIESSQKDVQISNEQLVFEENALKTKYENSCQSARSSFENKVSLYESHKESYLDFIKRTNENLREKSEAINEILSKLEASTPVSDVELDAMGIQISHLREITQNEVKTSLDTLNYIETREPEAKQRLSIAVEELDRLKSTFKRSIDDITHKVSEDAALLSMECFVEVSLGSSCEVTFSKEKEQPVLSAVELVNKLEQDKDDISSREHQVEKDKDSHNQAVLALSQRLKTIQEKENELSKCNSELSLYRSLVKHLKTHRSEYMKNVWVTILEVASNFARTASDNVIMGVGRNDNGQFTFIHQTAGELPVNGEASGAQKEIIGIGLRLALARCLYSSEPLLILDEPTSAMSNTTSGNTMATLMACAGEGQVIVISHKDYDSHTADNVIRIV